MTTADTLDVEKTVDESIRMVDAGSELVRITAPSKKEAEALGSIAAELRSRSISTYHWWPTFTSRPNAAEVAADHVEKIRVNPGNYADKKKFEEIDYTDESYAAELDRIETTLHSPRSEMQAIGTGHAHRDQSRVSCPIAFSAATATLLWAWWKAPWNFSESAANTTTTKSSSA